MHILIVEDEPSIANFVCQGLTEAGYAVDVAENGEQGLAFALAADYDVLILDIMLPKIDGLELLCKLRQREHPPHPDADCAIPLRHALRD